MPTGPGGALASRCSSSLQRKETTVNKRRSEALQKVDKKEFGEESGRGGGGREREKVSYFLGTIMKQGENIGGK